MTGGPARHFVKTCARARAVSFVVSVKELCSECVVKRCVVRVL